MPGCIAAEERRRTATPACDPGHHSHTGNQHLGLPWVPSRDMDAWRHRDIKQLRMCVHAHLTTCEPCSDASSWRKSSKHNALVQHAQGATRGARSRSHVCMRTWQQTGRARRMSQTRLHCGGGHPVRPEAACSACVHAHLAKCEPCSLVVAQLLRRMHTCRHGDSTRCSHVRTRTGRRASCAQRHIMEGVQHTAPLEYAHTMPRRQHTAARMCACMRT